MIHLLAVLLDVAEVIEDHGVVGVEPPELAVEDEVTPGCEGAGPVGTPALLSPQSCQFM
jgi:hypothetical protein